MQSVANHVEGVPAVDSGVVQEVFGCLDGAVSRTENKDSIMAEITAQLRLPPKEKENAA